MNILTKDLNKLDAWHGAMLVSSVDKPL